MRLGVEEKLKQVLEAEVSAMIELYQQVLFEGRKAVVRNGWMPERLLATPMGLVKVRQPRVRDRRHPDERTKFTSELLPKYARRNPSLEVLLPVLYLKGISTGNMQSAVESLLGPNAPGLSPSVITRLSQQWFDEYQEWSRRDFTGKHYVYIWADGIYSNVRLGGDRPCMLVVIGATAEGRKELLAIADGERESDLSWQELLLDLKRRGLSRSPSLAIADGALGFWGALSKVYPDCKQQNCWVHKTANVLDKLPKKLQPAAKQKIIEMYTADTKNDALKIYDDFISSYSVKYPRACNTLEKVKDRLFTFYEFPAEHWVHIRTSNVIESAFATIRLRSHLTKGHGSRNAALAMIYRLGCEAEKSWRRLNGFESIIHVLNNRVFEDGILMPHEHIGIAA
jgi:transposase-like protein